MPSLNATLAWAVCVDVETFGVNLEAYINLQPTTNMLHLCHRFGPSHAPLTRLPIELLNGIEDILVEAERDRLRKEWHEDYQCFRQQCSLVDHYTEHELDEIRVQMGCSCDECDGCDSPVSLTQYLKYDDVEFEVHHERIDSWAIKMGKLLKQEPILKRHFGLSMWTSTVRLNEAAKSDSYFPAEMTMAYLRLPGAPSVQRQVEYSERDYNLADTLFMLETGCAMDVTERLSYPKDAESRFKRAMRILDLKPCVHGGQEGLTCHPNEERQDAAKGGKEGKESKESSKVRPRLTVLVNTGA